MHLSADCWRSWDDVIVNNLFSLLENKFVIVKKNNALSFKSV